MWDLGYFDFFYIERFFNNAIFLIELHSFLTFFILGPFDFIYIVFGYCMNIFMSIYRSIELRKNSSGSYKVRLTIDRGSKFCGARKSLGLGTHREDCALRRAYLMRCLLFRMGWFPGGKIAVRNSAECGIKEIVWDSMEFTGDSGMFKLSGKGGRVAADEIMDIWFQTNGEEKVQRLRLFISGWRKDDRAGDLRVLLQGMQHCASEQRQHPCRILKIEIGAGSLLESRDECVLKG